MGRCAGLLLKEYKAKFAGSPVSATYTYLKQLFANNLPANPLVTHETDWNRLRNPSFLDATLRYNPASSNTIKPAMFTAIEGSTSLQTCCIFLSRILQVPDSKAAADGCSTTSEAHQDARPLRCLEQVLVAFVGSDQCTH